MADPEVEKVKRSYDYEIVQPSDGTKDSVRVVMGGKQYSPVDISAMILKKAKEDGKLFDAADVMEEAFNKSPSLRQKYANQVRLWRCGVSM